MRKSRYDGSPSAAYVSIDTMMERYALGRKPIVKLAKESKSLYTVGSWYRVDVERFDEYFRTHCRADA